MQIFVILFAALCFVFVFCFFGEEVSNHFQFIEDALYQCDWDGLSLDLQKNMPIAIILAQRPVYIGNFGAVHCTRETFQKVVYLKFQ